MKKFFLLLLLLSACTFYRPVEEQNSSIDVYFCPQDECVDKFIQHITDSRNISCAFYDLNLQELISILKERNATVMIEDKNKLEVFSSSYSEALMHNKFCVLDEKIVITGSMNPTERGNYYNNNNIVVINSKHIAQNYLEEFDELLQGKYGEGKKVPFPKIMFGNITVENYFCPEDDCKLKVINTIKKANSSVYFMTYSFTDEDIGNLLWNKEYLGLDVKGIMEKRLSTRYSRYNDLKEFTQLDKNPYTMHNKVFIIDNKTVITGSYNPTKNGNERNDENLLIIHDKRIAKEYFNEFISLYNFREKMPEEISEIVISEVLYDAQGRDEGNEYVELRNLGNNEINLGYYFLSNNKTNFRLSGNIEPNESIKVSPSFTLRNSEGILMLKQNHKIIDFVYWEGIWDLEAEDGQRLVRMKPEISSNAWTVN